jgi:site-specific DNA-cytosine methylase
MARLRRRDIVTIVFRRIGNVRIIRSVRIIGSASPCRGFLVVGRRVRPAEICLLTHRFRLVSSTRNILVFERRV